jgi:DNA polymerase-3 subunit epsilon
MDIGLIVDLETTGLDAATDRIIEIGILEFSVDSDMKPVVTSLYGALQDPGIPLSPEIEKLTGISERHLRGQAIDWDRVRGYFARAAVVIAHNADFDRGFLERSGELQGLRPHWACSMRHIDWRAHGFKTQSLNYLAADHGFVNPFAHRALFDCATTFRLVTDHLGEMIDRSHQREYLIKAVSSPFESKDVLRERGYRWEATERHWYRVVPEPALAEERVFLQERVYCGAALHLELDVTA